MKSRIIPFVALLAVAALMLGGFQASAQDSVTLRLSSWQWEDPAYIPFWEGTTKAFMAANPNVTIEKFSFPIDQLWDKVNIEIAAGTPPDLIEVTGFNVFQYIEQEALAPLNECFEGTDIPDKVQDQKTYAVKDGNIYALNLSARTLQLYINRKLFDEAGVKVPTNFEEFEAAAKALTIPEKEQFGLVLTNLAHSRLHEGVLVMIAGYGGHYTKDGKPALLEPEVIQGVTFFKKLFDAGYMPQGVKDGGAQYAWFNSGKAAMSIDGAWYWATMEQNAPDLLPFVEVHPIPTDTQAATGGVNNLIGIAADSPHYDIACEYIKSIATLEWAQVWVNSSRTIFPIEGSVTEDFLRQHPWYKSFADSLKDAVPVAAPGMEIYHTEMVKIINDTLVDILYNNRPIEEALRQAQAELEALMGM